MTVNDILIYFDIPAWSILFPDKKKLIWLRKEVNLFRINMDISLQFKDKEKRAKEAVNI